MSIFFFQHKPAYDMRMSDWSSDLCSSDLAGLRLSHPDADAVRQQPGVGHAGDAGLCRAAAGAGDHPGADPGAARGARVRRVGRKMGRASCRVRGCVFVEILGGAVCLTKKEMTYIYITSFHLLIIVY